MCIRDRQRRVGHSYPDKQVRKWMVLCALLLILPFRYLKTYGYYRALLSTRTQIYAVRDHLGYKHWKTGQRMTKAPQYLSLIHISLVIMLFVVHILVLVNCILNVIDSCIEGGLGILYSFLFLFIFNPIVIFLFYRGKIFITQRISDCAKRKPNQDYSSICGLQ